MQQLLQLRRLNAQDGFLLGQQPFFHHVHGDFDRRLAGALAVAGLQHVEFFILDGELKILHVPVVPFEARGGLAQLVIDFRQERLQLTDVQRRADARHHVLALRIHQELSVELLLAGGGIARKPDTRAARLPQIPKDHRLDVHGGPQRIGDVVHAPVVAGPGGIPGAEYGVPCHGELLPGVLRKGRAGFFLNQLLIIPDHLLEGLPIEVRVGNSFALFLDAFEDVVEIGFGDLQHDVAEHLEEAAVAVEGEPRVAGSGCERLRRFVIQPQVQDGVHHSGHRKFRAGADTHQQRILPRAELLPGNLFQAGDGLAGLLIQFRGQLPFLFKIQAADGG